MKFLKNRTPHQYILFGILLLGTVLRFWNFTEIPFTHDEFSALSRLHFDSFSELIEKGVKIDAHPAGVHVFMYYWIKLFGETEIVVKFPFILMGIASIYLIYRIGKLWFNSSVGLIVAAFMATMEFPIMYSQIARPYISGLFLCLFMVVFWSKLIKTPHYQFWKNYIGFILFASLCAYNHHFSLLFAAIVGVSGVFFIQKKYLLKYLLSGLLIFILYLPHLSIFLYQLNIGGVEAWLAKPKPDFLIEFIQYIFHFSTLVYLLVGAIIIGGFYLNKERKISKYFVLSAVWFLVPFLIGYYYSIHYNAVLQYSVLIFSFPFLLLAVFSFVPKLSLKIILPVILLIGMVNTYSLIVEREYYPLFYQNRFKQFLIETQKTVDKLGEENCTVLLVNHPKINAYYFKKLGLSFDYYNYLEEGKDVDDNNLDKVRIYVENAKTDYFIYGSVAYAPKLIYLIVKEHFPTLIEQKFYFASQFEVFSHEKIIIDEYRYQQTLNFDKENIGTDFEGAYKISEKTEYFPMQEILLDTLAIEKNDIIDLSVNLFLSDSVHDVIIAGSIIQNDSIVLWRDMNTDVFKLENNKWEFLPLSFSIRNFDFTKESKLKVVLWNRRRDNFYIDNLSVKIRKGNPALYGLSEKIK